ncbi:hypothetical protein [Thiocapsa sp. UBA6158]|jgi:serine/threonine protein kinase|uniref:hypothetical protein n=1 Tax=Thiocapsa sp. UBA6158 TaxID=1947692 RepID=UPI0025DCC094|nr:hypothetical protein [Thiocapsa sp. UBA6158]
MVDADFCRRFINEGRLIAKLTHPNIVTVYDIGASERYHAKTIGNETKLTSTGMLIGSIGYMSPEQARGLEVDNRSDLYRRMIETGLRMNPDDERLQALQRAVE